MKKIKFSELGMGCAYIVSGNTDEELIKIARDHVRHKHEDYWEGFVKHMSDQEVWCSIKDHIREE